MSKCEQSLRENWRARAPVSQSAVPADRTARRGTHTLPACVAGLSRLPRKVRAASRPGSDGGDSYAGVGQGGQDAGIGGVVGDQLAYRGDLADLGEGHQADLGAVGDDDDRAGALDQGAVRVGFHLVVGGEAGLEGDAVGADEHDVEVQAGQAGLGDGAQQLIGLGHGYSAGDDELEVGAYRHFGGDVQGVGDQGEALLVDEGPRDLGGGGAAGEADRVTFGDAGRGLAGDPELLFLVAAALVAERELVEDSVRDRAAVGAGQQALALKQAEVTADGGGRHAQLVRDIGDIYAAVPGQPLQDRLQPLRLPHWTGPQDPARRRETRGSDQATASPDVASNRRTSSRDIPSLIVSPTAGWRRASSRAMTIARSGGRDSIPGAVEAVATR